MQNENFVLDQVPVVQRQLRLAIVSETYPPEVNGVAMTASRMVSGLQRRGHAIQLIRPKQHSADTALKSEQIQELLHYGLPIPRYAGLRFGLPAKAKLVKVWQTLRPDLVHVVTEGPLGWSAIAAARKLKLPVTSDFHTNFHDYSRHYGVGWLHKTINAYLRKFHNQTLTTFVPTAELARDLGALGYRNLEVVSRGVDLELFNPLHRDADLRREWGLTEDGLAVLYVGRLAAEKNLECVFSAFEAIALRRPGARLILVGDGPQRPHWQAAYPQHVFAGMRIGASLGKYYASADLFLFPSLSETFGNVTTEAMASGLAVVAYDYAAAKAHIRNGENGRVVKFGDVDAFNAQAAQLAASQDEVRRLGQAAHAGMRALSWDEVFGGLERRFQELVLTWEQKNAQL